MKTVKLNLSKEAQSDRDLQISELVSFLNKDTSNNWEESTPFEIIEYDEDEKGLTDQIYWSVSEGVENWQGSFTFQLDC